MNFTFQNQSLMFQFPFYGEDFTELKITTQGLFYRLHPSISLPAWYGWRHKVWKVKSRPGTRAPGSTQTRNNPESLISDGRSSALGLNQRGYLGFLHRSSALPRTIHSIQTIDLRWTNPRPGQLACSSHVRRL